jgi:hypothetical protein
VKIIIQIGSQEFRHERVKKIIIIIKWKGSRETLIKIGIK